MHSKRDVVIFDFGGVLIDWNPRYLYRKLFGDDEAAMEAFLAEVTTPEWNLQQDAGRSWDEAVRLLTAEHPSKAELIAAYQHRWEETLGGAIDDSLHILRELKEAGHPLRPHQLVARDLPLRPRALRFPRPFQWHRRLGRGGHDQARPEALPDPAGALRHRSVACGVHRRQQGQRGCRRSAGHPWHPLPHAPATSCGVDRTGFPSGMNAPLDTTLPREREQLILERLRREGKVVAADLAQEFRVSEDSIRRDLRDLAAQGLCRRVYGGALLAVNIPRWASVTASGRNSSANSRGRRSASSGAGRYCSSTRVRPIPRWRRCCRNTVTSPW